jgi:hypothetical protein
MPLPMPLDPPTTSTCLPEKSSSFVIAGLPECLACLTCLRIDDSLVNHNKNKQGSEETAWPISNSSAGP